MTSEKLYEILGDINEESIREARISEAAKTLEKTRTPGKTTTPEKTKKHTWMKYLLAACLALIAYAGIKSISKEIPGENIPDFSEETPYSSSSELVTDTEDTPHTDSSELVKDTEENPHNDSSELVKDTEENPHNDSSELVQDTEETPYTDSSELVTDTEDTPYTDSSTLVQGTQENISTDLPLLTISEGSDGAMGYEGYMAYEISELVNANPWKETAALSTLPVYQNPLTYGAYNIASGADFEAMEAFLIDLASRFDMDIDHLNITDDTLSKEEQAIVSAKMGGKLPEGYFNPTRVIAEENGIKIEVDVSMEAFITFEPIPLPEGYHFSYHSSYEEMFAVAEYLQEAYKNVIQMEDPQIKIVGGDYDIDREQGYEIKFYDASGSLTDQILHYNFNSVAFYNSEGKLFLIRMSQPDLSDKTGDYPIISVEEATALLLQGNYITTVPYEMPGENYIAKTELIYRHGIYEEYFMPYYRFYVELPEQRQKDGLKTYGAYYVPAVDGAYLTNMPVWDGTFN